MGMFDTVLVNPERLPLTPEERLKLSELQTKDFYCELTQVKITDDGFLMIRRYDTESIPQSERPYPDGEGIMALVESIKEVNERWEILDFHGFFYFYDGHFSFKAKFTDGKLVEIFRLKDW